MKLTIVGLCAALVIMLALAFPWAASAGAASGPAVRSAPAGSAGAISPTPVAEAHPHIRAALNELREAKGELQSAAHDFGGHRADALKATDEAIHQLELCLRYDKK